MTLKYLIAFPLLFLLSSSTSEIPGVSATKRENPSKFSQLAPEKKMEALDLFLNGDCEYEGIKLYGEVKFVDAFPDIKIKFVESFSDINVQFVESFPNSCGKWKIVDAFPDFTVKVVDAFPDVKVKLVKSFPGMK